ncbi:curli production assembly protein CsgG [Paraburkholderia sp. UCT31]|uniref:CsgG/HfaB family protein n=1 Tax=Paraburkholderia sp. UCT31 TaxID=2615209 RepID=UPI001655C40E|nr:CsgG/HfaB family protein [Paraburkholderia sp. UCT31]MBC8740930.1 curli production assembly protein CsgG [Paraburkholderia sp. UCT31]
MKKALAISAAGAMLAACATVSTPPQVKEAPTPRTQQQAAQAVSLVTDEEAAVKRKIAIGRFSNETRYGRTFVTDANLDPLGKQASDILASRLVASKQFLVFERPDIAKVAAEQSLSKDAGLIGVDALILGSVTEFGRSTTGKAGFLSATKVQNAHAKVELRLVDVKTGYVFFSASGTGEASTESGEIAGFGSRADYDGSLNDKAISAAISDVIGRMMTKLKERPWKSDILKADGSIVYISGGALQGIKPGSTLHVYKAGESIQSGQTGFTITLPATPIATIRVTSNFGDSEVNEGSVALVTSGAVTKDKSLFVAE